MGETSTVPIAIVANVPTPYRVALHARIANELSGRVELHSLYTHDLPDQPWTIEGAEHDVTNPVCFGPGEPVVGRSPIRTARRDRAKGARMTAWMREHGIRFVICSGYNDAALIRIVRWCKASRVPCYLAADSNIKGERATGWKMAVKSRLVPWVLRQVSGAMPFGTAGAAYFRKYGVAEDRIVYWPCEPDYRVTEAVTEDDTQAAMQRFGLDPGRKRLVTCGRLAEVKRIDLAIDAFVRIADERPEWDLVIIGDGPLRGELEARVPEPLRERFKFLGFVNQPSDIAAINTACHVGVLPSDYEPWGLVVNEAAAAGLALVASDVVGAAPDLVKGGVNGRVFATGDAGALAEALLDATEHHERYASASATVLADYRAMADPVRGLVTALTREGLLGSEAEPKPS